MAEQTATTPTSRIPNATPNATPTAAAAATATAEAAAANPEPALLGGQPASGASSADAEGDAAPAATPAAYEAFRLPDGVALDETSLADATQLFHEARLDQATAQKFIDLAVSREQAAARRGVQAFVDLQNKWTGEVKADPEIGGDKLTASLAAAGRAIDRLNVAGLREALHLTGAGNNPAIVRAFVRLGQMLSEDRFAPGRNAAPTPPRSPADVIYDGSPRGTVGNP
jgi:hypothetical protein